MMKKMISIRSIFINLWRIFFLVFSSYISSYPYDKCEEKNTTKIIAANYIFDNPDVNILYADICTNEILKQDNKT